MQWTRSSCEKRLTVGGSHTCEIGRIFFDKSMQMRHSRRCTHVSAQARRYSFASGTEKGLSVTESQRPASTLAFRAMGDLARSLRLQLKASSAAQAVRKSDAEGGARRPRRRRNATRKGTAGACAEEVARALREIREGRHQRTKKRTEKGKQKDDKSRRKNGHLGVLPGHEIAKQEKNVAAQLRSLKKLSKLRT